MALSAAGARVLGVDPRVLGVDRNEEPLLEMEKAGHLADHLVGDLRVLVVDGGYSIW